VLHDPDTTRVTLVLDINDNPEILFLWIAARAARLIDELAANHNIRANLVSIDIDGQRNYHW
jgi:hypothetical protein